MDEIKSVQCVGTNFGKRDFLNLNENKVVSARTAKCCIKPFGHSYSMTRECVPLNNDLIIRENKGCFGSQEERGPSIEDVLGPEPSEKSNADIASVFRSVDAMIGLEAMTKGLRHILEVGLLF